MPKKRKSSKRASKTRYITKYRRNPDPIGLAAFANPSRVRSYGRRAYAKTRKFGGKAAGFLGLGPALKAALPALAGILCASLARKKWGGSGSAMGNWTWKDYAIAGLGTFGGTAIAKALFKISESTAHAINTGGIAIILYHMVQDEIVAKSATLQNWIGEEGEGSWTGAENAGYLPGDSVYGEDGSQYVMGSNGDWQPVQGYGEILKVPGALGEVLKMPGAMGFGAADPYDAAYRD